MKGTGPDLDGKKRHHFDDVSHQVFKKLHFSTADLEETWSIADSIKKLQRTKQKKNEWLVAFKEGVNLADKVVSDTFGDQIGEDSMARYDLTFLSPKSQAMRCKASLPLSPI